MRAAIQQHFADRPVTLLWNGFGIGKDKTLWSVEKASAKQQTMLFRRLHASGKETTLAVAELTCATYTFTFWGDWLITYSDPADPAGACLGIRRIP